ncbi:AAA family ATPase [Actinomycetospora lemnae]|uniref:AAA family ATPase n=1 Tax=Actinomycetospora lemnae TaxID=3019891 RepID=A0ABT5SWA0_9PSEU|nr:AAA family ATPase [Actinomycetospora sp. DW7H6]MDD7967133.1 AAA family ATPase [Actinomycetospora sp. DW7H6]
MRLHRIRLRDFRGVHDREVALAERGVTVLQGDNEVGKTSTVAALDLLFDAADSSRRADIRAAQPAGVDAGPEVEAEVSTGPYRFVYRKRWLRRPRTELHVLEPAREQLTGADAHARVTAILDETMDRVLWRGLRVEQHTAVGQADLGGQDALTRALDRAASGAARPDPTADDGLVERAVEELRRYRTPSGRATGELRAAEVRLADAETEHERCRAALEAVERDVAARDRLDADAAGVRSRRLAHAAQVAELEDRWAGLQSRLREVETARGRAVLARERAETARERREARDALVAAVEADAAVVERAEEARDAHDAEHVAAREERDVLRAADTAARGEAAAARRAADDTARAVSAARDRAELADLAERLRRVEEAESGLAAAERVLATATVGPDDLDALEDLARDLLRAEAARDAAATRVELIAPAELTVVVDGEPVTLAPGRTQNLPVAGSRAVSVPGVLDVRVRPGHDEAGRDDAVRACARALDERCADLGVADLEAARAARRRADEAARRAAEHRAARDRELAGHGSTAALREAQDAVRGRLGEDDGVGRGDDLFSIAEPAAVEPVGADLAALRQASDAARVAADDAVRRADEAGAACRAAEDAVRGAETRAAVLAERAADARHAHARRAEELRAARAAEPDADLAAAEEDRRARAREAEREHESLAAALADDDPDTVEARVVNARAVDERLAAEAARLEREHAETTGRLQAAGLEGWHDQLAAAATELEAAVRDHDAVARRAAAARRLHETLARHRDRVRRSYVAPFRAQVERLARIVFGPSLSLEIDEDLRITHRTLHGTTVAFGALSSGAQEQLGLCARLACAALVDPADGVPVVIDDALGHTDPERLARLGAVFTAATAAEGAAQVVVLTCTPERYHGIGAATVVPLAPSRRPDDRDHRDDRDDRDDREHRDDRHDHHPDEHDVAPAGEDTPARTPGTVVDLPRTPRAG